MQRNQKIASGIVWSVIATLAHAVYGFISVPLLLNYFGSQNYGIIGIATSINVYMQMTELGFKSTSVRFFSAWLGEEKYDKTKKLFQTNLALYGCIALFNAAVILVLSFFSAPLFHLQPEEDALLKSLLYILTASSLINWFSACMDQLIEGTENVAWIQRRNLLPKALQFLIIFATIYFSLSIFSYFLLTAFVLVSVLPLSVWKIKKEVSFASFIPRIDKGVLHEILPYFLNIFSFSIFQFSFENLRPVLLGIQGDVSAVTDFRILNGMISIVWAVGFLFLNTLLPSTSRIVAQGNQNAFHKVAYAGTKYASIASGFCVFGMMSVGSEMITLYVGEEYQRIVPWLYLWLLCSLSTHTKVITSLILAGSDIKGITKCTIFASILGLACTWLLIPYYQVGGCILAICVYVACELAFYYGYYWPKKMQVRSGYIFCRCFLPYVCLGGVLAFCITRYICIGNAWLAFFAKGVCFAVCYTAVCLLLLTKEDWTFLKSALRRS